MTNKNTKGFTANEWIESFNFEAALHFDSSEAQSILSHAGSLPLSPSLRYIQQTPYTILGSLDAKGLQTNHTAQKEAYDILFDDMALEQLLKPTIHGQRATQRLPDISPENETEPPSFLCETDSNSYTPEEIESGFMQRTQKFLQKMSEQLISSYHVRAALADGIRSNHPEITFANNNKLVIFEAQKIMAQALGEIIEHKYPNALTNPDSPIWERDTLTHLIYNIRDSCMTQSLQMALAFGTKGLEPNGPT